MSKKKSKNETKTKTVPNKDVVKDSDQVSTKKPDTQANNGKSNSGAGKGDKLRRGITQNKWEKKWEAIFRKKESTVVVDKGSTDEPEGTA